MSGLWRIAWRNIWRHKRRSFITIIAMSVGLSLCMAMMCLVDGSMTLMFDALVSQPVGHVRVEHPEYPKRRSLYETVPDAAARIATLEGIGDDNAVTGRLMSYALVGGEEGSRGGKLTGIEPAREARATGLNRDVSQGTFLTGPGQAVVGVDLFEDLELSLGEELVAVTQAADGSMGNALFEVVGVVSSGNLEIDRMGVFVSLAELQEMLVLEDQVHEIVMLAPSRDDVKALHAAAMAALPGEDLLIRPWDEANPEMKEMLEIGAGQSYATLFIIFILAGIGVTNTMLMSVMERTRELGVMKALGAKPGYVIRLVLTEALILGLVSCVIGGLMGAGMDWYLVERGMDLSAAGDLTGGGIRFPSRFKGEFHVVPALVAIVSLIVVSVMAALWPSWRAARLNPVDAMRWD